MSDGELDDLDHEQDDRDEQVGTQREQPRDPGSAHSGITEADRAPSVLNIADMRLIEVCRAHLVLTGQQGGIFNFGRGSPPLS